jgi:hypothetical protein
MLAAASHPHMKLSVQRKTARSLKRAGGAWSVLRYRCHPWLCPCCASSSRRLELETEGMPKHDGRMADVAMACHKLDTMDSSVGGAAYTFESTDGCSIRQRSFTTR